MAANAMRTASRGIGVGGIAAATFAANAALGVAVAGFGAAANLFSQSLAGIKGFQQNVISLRSTLQTMGDIPWAETKAMAEDNIQDIERIAASLPGRTEDYVSILSRTYDDQLMFFGTVEKV